MVRNLGFFHSPKHHSHATGIGSMVQVGSTQCLRSAGRIHAGDSHSLQRAICSAVVLDTKHPPNFSVVPLENFQAKRNYKNYYSYNDQTA